MTSVDFLAFIESAYDEVQCVNCGAFTIGKSAWKCAKCQKPVCESICNFGVTIGCSDFNDRVCSSCFRTHYGEKKVYCDDSSCNCLNAPPKRKAKLARRARFNSFPMADLDKTAWKATHNPINYPGRYHSRYLVDIATSNDAFEKGYIDWLIKEGSKKNNSHTDEENANFQIYVEEAKELKLLLKPRAYNFRKRK